MALTKMALTKMAKLSKYIVSEDPPNIDIDVFQLKMTKTIAV